MKLWKIAATACTAGTLALASANALAGLPPEVSLTGTGGSAAPDAIAFANMTISFAYGYDFAGVDIDGFFDPSKLSFNAAHSSVNLMGVPYSLADFMSALTGLQLLTGGDFSINSAGVSSTGQMFLSAGFASGSQLLPPGDVSVTLAFNILPTVSVGTSTDVTFTQIWLTDFNNEQTLLATNGDRVILSVTAVPEPETWWMMLAGACLLGAMARRRSTQA